MCLVKLMISKNVISNHCWLKLNISLILFFSLFFLCKSKDSFLINGDHNIYFDRHKRYSNVACFDDLDTLIAPKLKKWQKSYSHRTPLSIGVLLPESYKRRIKPSIELALEHVHTTPNLLPDYCFRPIYKDTQCKTSMGMKSLFDLMNTGGVELNETELISNPDHSVMFDEIDTVIDDINRNGELIRNRPAALFGGICTDVNEPVAMASKYWDILHLSYAETHSKFSTADTKDLYPTFFRIVPGDMNLIAARCQLIKHFNWNRVGTIKQSDEPFYALPHERLTTVLENVYNVSVVYTAGLSSDQINAISYELEELKRRDAHIIISDFSAELGLHVLCEAYHRGMYGADYLWILPGYHRPDWWRDSPIYVNEATPLNPVFGDKKNKNKPIRQHTCTLEQMREVLQGHFALEFAPLRPYSSQLLISNRTIIQIQRELRQYCQRSQISCQDDVFSAYAYDGIWTLALALNKTIYGNVTKDLLKNGNPQPSPLSASRLVSVVGETSFEGLTGHVRFENNERLGLLNILQWINGSYSKVGFFDSALSSFYLRHSAGWKPPLDAIVVKRERQYVSYYLLASMSLLSIIGILLALIFFFINVKYRNHRFIKMSSPNMNNLIIVGSICAYTAVFLLGIDTRFVSSHIFEKLCYAKTWVLSVGFTLAFGSMFSKTWRVHSIFTNIRRDKKAIKDTRLYMIVATILLIDIIILGLWALISPFGISITELPPLRSQNVLIVPELERCVSEFSVVFQVVFYIFKGMLMLFGCFLAWETRAVNVPALNDSKYIGMSVYLVVVMCLVGLSLAFILQERLNEAFALISFFIVFCTTLTLLLVFMPKVIELIRAPRGADQQKRYRHKHLMKSMVSGRKSHRCDTLTTTTTGIDNSNTDNISQEISLHSPEGEGIKEKICTLEEENLRLHEILVAKSTELWDLLEKLRVYGESIRTENGFESSGVCCVGAQLTGKMIPKLEQTNAIDEKLINKQTSEDKYDSNKFEIVDNKDNCYYENGNDDSDEDEEEVFVFYGPYRQRKLDVCDKEESNVDEMDEEEQMEEKEVLKGSRILPISSEVAKSGAVLAMTLIAATSPMTCAVSKTAETTMNSSKTAKRSSTFTPRNCAKVAQKMNRSSSNVEGGINITRSNTVTAKQREMAETENLLYMPTSSATIELIESNNEPCVGPSCSKFSLLKKHNSEFAMSSRLNHMSNRSFAYTPDLKNVILKNSRTMESNSLRTSSTTTGNDDDTDVADDYSDNCRTTIAETRRLRAVARNENNEYFLLRNSCSSSSISSSSGAKTCNVTENTPLTTAIRTTPVKEVDDLKTPTSLKKKNQRFKRGTKVSSSFSFT